MIRRDLSRDANDARYLLPSMRVLRNLTEVIGQPEHYNKFPQDKYSIKFRETRSAREKKHRRARQTVISLRETKGESLKI